MGKRILAIDCITPLLLGYLAISLPAPLLAFPRVGFKTVFTLSGTCENLSVPGKDYSSMCTGILFHMVYRNGRESFAFPAKGKALISFSGFPGPSSRAATSLKVDHITTASGANALTDAQIATGSCELTIPKPETFAIKCNARCKSGAFAASFVSDGKRPERQDF